MEICKIKNGGISCATDIAGIACFCNPRHILTEMDKNNYLINRIMYHNYPHPITFSHC